MRRTRRAATAAVSISLALTGLAAAAHADASSVLYVSKSSTTCTDTGTGTEAAPFCTIQAAANAAVAGDTVDIEAGAYAGAVDVKSAGTAAAPIVFQAVGGGVSLNKATGQTSPALSFDGASYVTFEGGIFGASQGMTVQGTIVNGSSHIALDSLRTSGKVEITGTSTDVTLSRSWLQGVENAGVSIDAGSAGDVVTTNWFENIGNSISVTDAANVAITSNTIGGNGFVADAISIAGASTGVTVENNVVADPGTGTSAGSGAEIAVDADAAAGTTVDYNIAAPSSETGGSALEAAYSWAGTDYASASALYAATGQAKHDLNSNPDLYANPYTDTDKSPLLNSANSAAPGMLSTDMYGDPCTGDPIVAVSGAGTPAYCARGAVQAAYTTTVSAEARAVTALSVSLDSLLQEAFNVHGEAYREYIDVPPTVSYTINWGDGAIQTYAGSTTQDDTASPHTYAKAGTYTITDTADFTNGTTAVTTTSFTTGGSDYTPYGPTRILDTRKGLGAPKAKVAAGGTVTLKVAGVGTIPAGISAVAVNLTVTDAAGGGYVDAVPDGYGVLGSTLNYGSGQTVANSAIVQVAADGSIDLHNEGGSIDLVADVTGYFTPTSGYGYTAATRERILDTRNATGAPKAKVASKAGLAVAIVGKDSIPSNVKAVAVHVTVTDASGGGWIAAEPDGAGVPGTSSLNFGPGQTISNTVIVPVAADGKIELYNGSSGSVDLVADVSGYFSATSPNAYVPVTPYRAWDTRKDGNEMSPYGADPYWLADEVVTGNSSNSLLPTGAIVASNITVTGTTNGGDLVVYPDGTSRPAVSDLNFGKGQTVANFAIMPTSYDDQQITVYNASNGYGQLILDGFGYFLNY